MTYGADEKDHTPSTSPIKRAGERAVAVALTANKSHPDQPAAITATGRGKLAEEILEIAFANGIPVREDCALTEILAQLDLDTPIPSEAIVLVAEILAKVYEANTARAQVAKTESSLTSMKGA
ncbi:MAG: EscU/YscU/HrcU family type III secretion system export apparatus switch protein [Bdellovibrionales bacterium]|jgi:flagellar biosynthesis protein